MARKKRGRKSTRPVGVRAATQHNRVQTNTTKKRKVRSLVATVTFHRPILSTSEPIKRQAPQQVVKPDNRPALRAANLAALSKQQSIIKKRRSESIKHEAKASSSLSLHQKGASNLCSKRPDEKRAANTRHNATKGGRGRASFVPWC